MSIAVEQVINLPDYFFDQLEYTLNNQTKTPGTTAVAIYHLDDVEESHDYDFNHKASKINDLDDLYFLARRIVTPDGYYDKISYYLQLMYTGRLDESFHPDRQLFWDYFNLTPYGLTPHTGEMFQGYLEYGPTGKLTFSPSLNHRMHAHIAQTAHDPEASMMPYIRPIDRDEINRTELGTPEFRTKFVIEVFDAYQINLAKQHLPRIPNIIIKSPVTFKQIPTNSPI